MLKLINAERARAGLEPVTLGGNAAAQLHAEALLRNCVSSHWGVDGLKPYMRYSLAGGYQSNAENWSGNSYCIRESDGYRAIDSVEQAILEAMAWLMDSPGHRDNILDRRHRKINVGLAWDEYNFVAIQHFQGDYVRYHSLPAIDDGILSMAGTTRNGAAFSEHGDLGVQVFYDPPPHTLSRGQVSRTYCYDNGLLIAALRPPPGENRYYTEHEFAAFHRSCPDPYGVPADAAGPVSPEDSRALWRAAFEASQSPPELAIKVPRITALEWNAGDEAFSVSADIGGLLTKHGPGVYTVTLWGHIEGEDAIISQYSIFHALTVPDTYGAYRDDPIHMGAQVAATPTASPTTTAASPKPTATSMAVSASDAIWGPRSGELSHDPADDLIKTEFADVSVADMIVEATFVNPYGADEHAWDYGFILRAADNGPRFQVVLTSQRRWSLIWRAGPFEPYEMIGGGTSSSMETGAGGRNHLMVVAIGGRGWVFVNGELMSPVDLGGTTLRGDVAVITGAYRGSEVAGEVTRYEDFEGRRLRRRYGPADGKLVRSSDEFVSEHGSGVLTLDLVAEAEFVNPEGENWDYGMAIRRSESTWDVMTVSYVARWYHHSLDESGDYETEAFGDLSSSRVRGGKSARLTVIAIGDAGWLFVDGGLVAVLDLGHNRERGEVSAVANFWIGHDAQVAFRDFTVWAP